MSLKSDLLPAGKSRLIDLVAAAGLSVAEWGNYARGSKYASTNPRFCYEWAFIDPKKLVILNLWYANITEKRGKLSLAHNMRAEITLIRKLRSKSIWATRAARFDAALQAAYSQNLPIRVIVNDGSIRQVTNASTKASTVASRLLDPVPWTLKSYDTKTGAYVLVRGVGATPLVDQFSANASPAFPTESVDKSGKVFVRDPAIRAAALARASGRCEYCHRPGFMTSDGSIFLETHHIVPLSEGGPDVLHNVAALCPNHHREAHYGVNALHIQSFLQDRFDGTGH